MESAGRVSPDTWRAATWSVPLVLQLVLALFLSASWAAGKSVLAGDTFRTITSVGAATSTLLGLVISIVLCRSRSSRWQGVGLAVAGSAAAVLIGWIIAAFWIYE